MNQKRCPHCKRIITLFSELAHDAGICMKDNPLTKPSTYTTLDAVARQGSHADVAKPMNPPKL